MGQTVQNTGNLSTADPTRADATTPFAKIPGFLESTLPIGHDGHTIWLPCFP